MSKFMSFITGEKDNPKDKCQFLDMEKLISFVYPPRIVRLINRQYPLASRFQQRSKFVYEVIYVQILKSLIENLHDQSRFKMKWNMVSSCKLEYLQCIRKMDDSSFWLIDAFSHEDSELFRTVNFSDAKERLVFDEKLHEVMDIAMTQNMDKPMPDGFGEFAKLIVGIDSKCREYGKHFGSNCFTKKNSRPNVMVPFAVKNNLMRHMIYLTNVYSEQSKHRNFITVIQPWSLRLPLDCLDSELEQNLLAHLRMLEFVGIVDVSPPSKKRALSGNDQEDDDKQLTPSKRHQKMFSKLSAASQKGIQSALETHIEHATLLETHGVPNVARILNMESVVNNDVE